MSDEQLDAAARAVSSAAAIVVGAGAGMGVDSGLPDFRGPEGFWRAYPPYERLGLSFVELANPALFHRDPPLAWGFYGHRRALYRRTEPHAGFAILRRWLASAPQLVRINPREPEVSGGQLGIAGAACAVLTELDARR